ncbi:MAG: dUTP diphosphatase [Nitrospinota bacterium]|nr:dUTP diphosphatase [Nitrospinota bacterium]
MFVLKAKKLDPKAKLPNSAHPGDLACDLFALEETVIPAKGQVKIKTGIALEFPDGWGGIVKDRSSLASARLYTSAGVIDAGYRGEVMILMRNDNDSDYTIGRGDKIAQIVPLQAQNWRIVEAMELSDTVRAENGFGSTGKR